MPSSVLFNNGERDFEPEFFQCYRYLDTVRRLRSIKMNIGLQRHA